jgi:hypothetical protein
MVDIFYVDGHRGYMFQGVFFTEGRPSIAKPIAECKTSSNVQNTNMDWLRERLAEQVRANGGNALIGFQYVQKANVFSFSSVSWNASGTAAKIENLESFQPEPGIDAILSEQKPCPFCAETILVAAKKCKHCGEFLR